MSFVRIRLTFQRHLPLAEVKNCWFLVDTSTCSTIADLEYLIKKRFKALAKSCSSVDLFLDDFLLPSQEKIEIIQNNDNIRVEIKQMILNQESRDEETDDQATEKKLKRKKEERSLPDESEKSKQKKVDGSGEVLNQTKKKRKKLPEKDFQNGNTTKTHSKKAKKEKSFSQANKNQVKEKKIEKAVRNKLKSNVRKVAANENSSLLALEERKSILALPSTSTFKAQLTKSSKHSKGKSVKSSQSLSSTSDAGKRKNTLELLQTNSKRSKANASEKDKDIVTGKKAADSDSSSSESSSSTESSSESTDESGPSNSPFKINDMASPVASAAVINSNKSPLHKRLGKDAQHETSTGSVSVKLSNGKNRKVETGKGLKSSLVSPGNSKENGTARPSTSLSLSSSDLSIDANKSKDAITKDAQLPSSSSSLSSPSLEETNLENSKKTSSSLLHPSSSSPSLLSSPSILRRIQMDTTDESSVNQSMSSIIEKSDPLGLKHSQQSLSTRQNKKPDSNFSTSHIRFDSEESEEETTEKQHDISSRMNITNDLNSTQSSSSAVASKQNHQTKSEGAVSKFEEPAKRDYSICTPLHGPPRSGDKIAYKVLELSASYTPEVSSYKEGTVLNFDPSSGAINVELAKESLKRARGDGNVSGKFELVYDESEENVEESPEVVTAVLWNAMIDPVLIK